jgi:hypothetical protein
MERIIISTSWDKLNFLRRRRTEKNLQLIGTNKFIFYDHTSQNFVVNKADSNIILIQDTATEANLTALNINKDTDYFLHHTNENGLLEVQDTLFQNNRIAQGLHEPLDEHKYQPVFNIILDNENNKFNRILGQLNFTPQEIAKKETLEAKLNFLHQCLTPDGLGTATIDASWSAETQFEALKQVNDGPFGENYIKALTTLRDKLLVD